MGLHLIFEGGIFDEFVTQQAERNFFVEDNFAGHIFGQACGTRIAGRIFGQACGTRIFAGHICFVCQLRRRKWLKTKQTRRSEQQTLALGHPLSRIARKPQWLELNRTTVWACCIPTKTHFLKFRKIGLSVQVVVFVVRFDFFDTGSLVDDFVNILIGQVHIEFAGGMDEFVPV